MNIYIAGSHCPLYKCAGIGIQSDTPFKSDALRHEYITHCATSSAADANALRDTLHMILYFDKKTLRANPKIFIRTSDMYVVKRFLKEVDMMYIAGYYRPEPWIHLPQLLRDLHDKGLLGKIKILHCDRNDPTLKLAIKQAKCNLRVIRNYITSLHEEKETSNEERISPTD